MAVRVGLWVVPALRKLGFGEKFAVQMITLPTSTDTSVIWCGCRVTNSVSSQNAVLSFRSGFAPAADSKVRNGSDPSLAAASELGVVLGAYK